MTGIQKLLQMIVVIRAANQVLGCLLRMGITWDRGEEEGRWTATPMAKEYFLQRRKREREITSTGKTKMSSIPSHAAHPKRLMSVPSLDTWTSQEPDPQWLKFVFWWFKSRWNSWFFILKFQAAKCRAVGATYEHLKSLCIRTEAGHFRSMWCLSSLLLSQSLYRAWRTRRSLVTGRSKNACFNSGGDSFNCETR